MSRPWMPFYVADYRADTAHLGAAEHGAYVLLILHYWTTGGLPTDDKQLARIACMSPREWSKTRNIIKAFFQDNWKHKRIEKELAHATEVSSKRREAVNQRKNNPPSNDTSIDPSNDDTRARASPSQSKKDGATAPIEGDPEADLFNRGKKVLGKEAGGLIAKLLKANGGSIPKTRAVIEVASTKSNPREYVGGALRRNGSVKPEDRDWTEAVGFSSENIPWQESIG